jgi:hypothetical protein
VIADEHLLSLLDLAREYQTDAVISKCDRYIGTETELGVLKGSGLTADRLLLFLHACEVHGFDKHLPRLTLLAAEKMSREMKASKYFASFPATVLTDVMTLRCGRLEGVLQDVEETAYRNQHEEQDLARPDCSCTKSRTRCHRCRVPLEMAKDFKLIFQVVQKLKLYSKERHQAWKMI